MDIAKLYELQKLDVNLEKARRKLARTHLERHQVNLGDELTGVRGVVHRLQVIHQ